MVIYDIVWTKRAQQHLLLAYNFITKDSLQNAEKVVTDIVTALNKSSRNPEHYPPDKYKQKNDGTYRAFEKHRYRIAYRFSGNVIRVLRVRHVSMEPREY